MASKTPNSESNKFHARMISNRYDLLVSDITICQINRHRKLKTWYNARHEH